jgi:acyl-[acyl-carrier-protein] desaturase
MTSSTSQSSTSHEAPASPASGSPRIPVAELAGFIEEYAVEADQRTYPIMDRSKWPRVEAGLLTEDQISALRFITFIEDHIPGYFAEYQRLFPFGLGTPEAEALYNREMHRFTTRWAVDEERHADLLCRYQVHAGVATAEELRRQLIVEGVKPFTLEQSTHVAGIVAYTVIQEKATQIFYRRFEKQLQEPLLGQILTQLARDESRHFAFFCRVLEAYLRTAPASSLEAIKEVLFQFKMPLSSTLKGYWRWALRVSDAMSYDHTEAYEHLLRVVERTADAASDSRTAGLGDFVRQVRRTPSVAGTAR